jgi:cobalamin biosynthesis Mg chelatase CobN
MSDSQEGIAMTDRPTDPAALRAEIDQTRTDLGETVAALTAKADVKARAKQAAAQAVDDVKTRTKDAATKAVDGVKATVAHVTEQASDTASQVRERATSSAVAARDRVTDLDVAQTARRPVPIAVVAGAAALIALAIVIWRRRR